MNKRIFISIVLVIIILVGGFAIYSNKGGSENAESNKEMVTVNHKYGEIEIPKNPENVVVLDYGALDTLDLIGVEIDALPKKNLPQYLDKYKDDKYVDLGGLKEFDLEKINELNPDLIIIEGRQEDYYEELSKIAPTLFIEGDNTDFVKSVKDKSLILGKIFDKENMVEEELAKIDDEMSKVSEKVKEKNVDASVLFISDSSLSVYGEKSRFNIIYNEFGFKINDPEVSDSNHGESISYEYILKSNPDYIFVIDKNVVTGTNNNTAKELMENDLVKSTKSYENGNIVYLDSGVWYVGGAGIQSLNKRMSEINEVI